MRKMAFQHQEEREVNSTAQIIIALGHQDSAALGDEIDALAGEISKCFNSLPDEAQKKCVKLAHSLAVVRGKISNLTSEQSVNIRPLSSAQGDTARSGRGRRNRP